MKRLIAILWTIIYSTVLLSNESKITISFGSCYKQKDDPYVFEHINSNNPDGFFWLGDIVYADHFSPERRMKAYQTIKEKQAYDDLASNTIIDGTWDDHDYAYNNADHRYRYKKESKIALLNFLEFKESHPVYSREGIYHKRNVSKKHISVDTFFLDTRTFMHKCKNSILGETQWIWLEDQIKKANSDLIIIASSLNIFSPVSPFLFWIEGWHKFKKDKKRLIELLDSTRKRIIFFSGDRHYSDLSTYVSKKGKKIFEFMSSGMSKTSEPLKSKHRIKPAIEELNFSNITVMKTSENKIQIRHEIFHAKEGNLLQENILTIQ